MVLYILAGLAIMMLSLNRSDVIFTVEEKFWVVLLMGVLWPLGVCVCVAMAIYEIIKG